MSFSSQSSPSAAVQAFLRGLHRRAWLLATIQCGAPEPTERALRAAAQVFASEADTWPMPQWPLQYWRVLLSVPAVRRAAPNTATTPLPELASADAITRAAVLLLLVAGLSEVDAAAVLGMEVAAFEQRIRTALPRTADGQPDLDAWRRWHAAVQQALKNASIPPAPSDIAPQPHAPASATPPPRSVDERRHTHRLRWLWAGVGIGVVALAATFFIHPRGRALLDQWRNQVRVEALPAAAAPKARFNPGDAREHPDYALLAAPNALQLARDLPMLAWLSAAASDALPTDPTVPLPPHAEATRTAADLNERLRRWDALPPPQRAQQRAAWAEWQALTDAERRQLHTTAARFATLPAAQQQALRGRYAALSFDAHRGWHLGPTLGRDWPRVMALFAFTDAAERDALMQLLRQATPEDIEVLARLAQTTPPEARAQLRRDLLAQPPAQRLAWMQAQLNR